MKQTLRMVCLLFLLTGQCFAQNSSKTSPARELGEAIIRKKELNKANHKIRPQNIYFRFLPENIIQHTYDSLFEVTHFPALDTGVVLVSSVELKLASFDTSIMDIMLFLYQENDRDTLMYTQRIDISQSAKQHKLKLYLDQPVRLSPDSFYLGYNFRLKHIPAPYYDYRLYATGALEGGSMLHLFPSGFKRYNMRLNVFWFDIAYYKP